MAKSVITTTRDYLGARERHRYNFTDVSDLIPEKEKLDKHTIITKMKYALTSLVLEKDDIYRARMLYNKRRDPQEFKYLENSYGIGNPNQLRMPRVLIRPHIEVLKGIVAADPLDYYVTSNNYNTILAIENSKKQQLVDEWKGFISSYLSDGTFSQFEFDSRVEQMKGKYNEHWVSDIEVAAQHLIEYYKRNPSMKLRNKIVDLMEDILITGEGYYRAWLEHEGEDPLFEVIPPENIWFSKNYFNNEIRDCHEVVVRRYMTKHELTTRYGHMFDKDAIEMIWDMNTYHSGLSGRRVYNRWFHTQGQAPHVDTYPTSPNIGYNYQYTNSGGLNYNDIVEVWHYEYIQNNKKTITDPDLIQQFISVKDNTKLPKKLDIWIQDRYECMRVGEHIYFNMGKSRHVVRDLSNPRQVKLSYNGINYQSRDGYPYSFVLKSKDTQDIHDILSFHRDNLIANSGVRGSRINAEDIPEYLAPGAPFHEKLMKFLALRKQGVELVSPSQSETPFNYYGDFNNSLDGNSIQAIEMTIERIKDEISYDTGVSPQMIAQMETREAVGNVQASMVQSTYLTKPLFQSFYMLVSQLFTDLVNLSARSYKTMGKMGMYRDDNGITQRFNIPEDILGLVSFDIFITDSRQDKATLEGLKAIAGDLLRSGAADMTIINILTTSTSITYAKKAIAEYLTKIKQEQQQTQQLQQQIEQLGQENKQLKKELEKLNAQEMQIKQAELEIKRLDTEEKTRFNKDKMKLEREKVAADKETKKQHLKLEEAQLYIGNEGNKEIKDI